jgi:hypothetical protein
MAIAPLPILLSRMQIFHRSKAAPLPFTRQPNPHWHTTLPNNYFEAYGTGQWQLIDTIPFRLRPKPYSPFLRTHSCPGCLGQRTHLARTFFPQLTVSHRDIDLFSMTSSGHGTSANRNIGGAYHHSCGAQPATHLLCKVFKSPWNSRVDIWHWLVFSHALSCS